MTGATDHGARRGAGGKPTSRRSLRAVLSADLAGFSGQVSVDETSTLIAFKELRDIALAQLEKHNGWLFGMPGDGLFALFESAVDAVECAIELQQQLAERQQLAGLPMRIGIHLGEVLFDNELPFGEALAIAARLEALAEPGAILISAPVFDAVSARINATFENRGTPRLKNIPRRIPTFSVKPLAKPRREAGNDETSALDHTMHLDRRQLRQVRDGTYTPSPPATSAPGGEPPPPAPSRPAPPAEQAPASALPEFSPTEPPECPPATVPPAPVSPAGTGMSLEMREHIADLLAFYLGPMARVMVERFARQADTPEQLVAFLEDEIPDRDERMAFRLRATQVILNDNQS